MSPATARLEAVLPDFGRVPRSVVAAGISLLLVAGLAGAGYLAGRNRPARFPLYADTVALGPGGPVVEAAAGQLVPGTRVLASAPDAAQLAAAEDRKSTRLNSS